MKNCLFCAEEIKDAAVICRYCGGNQAAVAALAMRRELNWKAVFSLVMSVLWISGIGSLLAVTYGHLAQKEIDESLGSQGGRNLATWGIILGWVGLGLVGIGILALMIAFADEAYFNIVTSR